MLKKPPYIVPLLYYTMPRRVCQCSAAIKVRNTRVYFCQQVILALRCPSTLFKFSPGSERAHEDTTRDYATRDDARW